MNGELPVPAGLCATCRWQKLVVTRRDSVFSLCRRSETDARFPKYPALPVLQCVGFEKREDRQDR